LIFVPVPTAVKLLKREYFNRWYGLKAYYMAITVASIPPMVSNCYLHLVKENVTTFTQEI
jgi:hypothetical protein